MPDRILKPDELLRFLREYQTRDLFLALNQLNKEGTEPSLYDLCFHELSGIADAQKNFIVQHGKDIFMLKEDADNKDVVLQTQNDVLQKLLKRIKVLEKKNKEKPK